MGDPNSEPPRLIRAVDIEPFGICRRRSITKAIAVVDVLHGPLIPREHALRSLVGADLQAHTLVMSPLIPVTPRSSRPTRGNGSSEITNGGCSAQARYHRRCLRCHPKRPVT